MGNLSERSHYLPQFYQRGFSGKDGSVWVFDRETNEFRLQQPVHTAVERGAYTLIDENGAKSDGIESDWPLASSTKTGAGKIGLPNPLDAKGGMVRVCVDC